jgi:hypothetical protein
MLKSIVGRLLNYFGYYLIRTPRKKKYKKIFDKYRDYTMIHEGLYHENLRIIEEKVLDLPGDVVECGVWRGGMSAGIAEVLGVGRNYHLFDSFEGLPDAKEIDGKGAKEYQENKDSEFYFDNCTAEIQFAEKAMSQTGVSYKLIKGWFNETLKRVEPLNIALLRLDGDWYDSTMDCLVNLYPYVVENGLIIIDDYYQWDGCSRAVHDYLSSIKSISRISDSTYGVCYIIKKDKNE